jgi:Uma2 family endonuclease
MAIFYRTEPEYFERLDGVDYPKVSPKRRHAVVQGTLVKLFWQLAPSGSGEIGPEWRFWLGKADGTDSAFLPDVAYIAKGRIRALPPKQREEPPFAPDIAVEVRSPRERTKLRETKIVRYLATGAKLVLDVDPERREIHAYDAAGCATFRRGERFANELFPWLAFDVGEVFADLDD